MGPIARLLFGREAGSLVELFLPDEQAGSDLAERARRAGEWCASTPGRGEGPARHLWPQAISRDHRGR